MGFSARGCVGTPIDFARAKRLWAALALFAALAVLAAAATPDAHAKGAKGKTIKGTNKGDRIVGTKHKDRINARGGNDRVAAKGGNDRIKTGSGKDKVKAGSGKDKTSGGSGKDKINSGSGKDKVNAGSGKDKVKAGSGNDKVKAGSGDDAAKGGGGKDALFGNEGTDKLVGGGGDDSLDAVDGAADARVAGGPGTDSCRVDAEDVPQTSGCEDLDVVGGDPDPDPDPDPGPDPDPDPALTIEQKGFTCLLPSVLGLPTPCTFSLSGAGADGPGGTISGTGGVANAQGSPEVEADGTWAASGLATCTAAGGLEVTIGDESASVAVACESGDAVPLSVTSSNFSCLPPVGPAAAVCTFVLAGEGADTVDGTVDGDGTNVDVAAPVPAVAVAGGSWTAVGAATCTADGELNITFGTEAVSEPVTCAAGGGGGTDNGPLTILAGDPVTCSAPVAVPPLPTVPGICVFSLIGGGADNDSGTIAGTGGVTGVTAVPPSGLGGSWTAAGTANCTADGTLVVEFADESVVATVNCGP